MLVANAYPGLLEGLIPLGIGVYMTLVYCGVIPAGLDAKKAAKWRARWAPRLRFGGPLLILVGLVLIGRALFWR